MAEKFYRRCGRRSSEISANLLGVLNYLLVTFNKIADLPELGVESKLQGAPPSCALAFGKAEGAALTGLVTFSNFSQALPTPASQNRACRGPRYGLGSIILPLRGLCLRQSGMIFFLCNPALIPQRARRAWETWPGYSQSSRDAGLERGATNSVSVSLARSVVGTPCAAFVPVLAIYKSSIASAWHSFSCPISRCTEREIWATITVYYSVKIGNRGTTGMAGCHGCGYWDETYAKLGMIWDK